jgi:ABC-type transport system substrate-binding protein
MPFDALKAALDKREFEASVYGFGVSLQLKQGDVWSKAGGYNYSNYECPEMEALVARVRDESDPVKLREALIELQRLVHRDQPMTFLCWFSRIAVVKSKFRAFRPDALSFISTVTECYVPRSRQERFAGE